MKKEKTEGMKSKPSGGADRKPFASNIMPSNMSKAVGGVKKMLSAIKHPGSMSKPSKMPFC